MYDVAVFTALGWEARAVTGGLSGVEPGGRSRAWRGYLGDGASCWVTVSGVGPARARAAADTAPPARLYLSAGCAGGLAEWLGAGDLVAATSLIVLDRTGRPEGTSAAAGAPLVAAATVRGLVVHGGALATSPVLLATAESKAAAAASGALVVDMESGPLAAAARARGASFAALRVVLDEAGAAVPIDPGMLDETGEVRALRALSAFAVHPARWGALIQLARGRVLAARRLRMAMAMLLGGGLDALGLVPLSHQAAG